MRIVLIGQAAFGAKTLESLLEKGETVAAVYSPPDRPDGRQDPLTAMALARSVPVLQPANYKDDEIFYQYQQIRPDLTILAFVTAIIPSRFLEFPSNGAICYHPSLLPRHRGASAINWAVIMGDTKTGLTIFWPDGGIDTGPILLQKEIPIDSTATTGSLYFDHLFPMGVEAILQSVAMIKAGQARKIRQDPAQATYEPPCDDRVAAVDWQKPATEIYNLIRGCDPQPGAYTFWKGEKVRLYGSRLDSTSRPEPPGTVVQINQEGLHIAVPGGTLAVGKIRTAGTGKITAIDFAGQSGLQSGAQLTAKS